ncbi:hypothetical protein [Scleromatobacter humisilvae]|uniref:DUF2993 domain-containing protein n=1 Tax=Scleromatobacter humisilvae TaxID=2897159 RepID=A0A9X1YJ25_9BURK|nr:hypothetical protein [Scleromatobacter humisilvae]MCK9687429.1 hypothetical protein [Scleromatobacter humisilvae]
MNLPFLRAAVLAATVASAAGAHAAEIVLEQSAVQKLVVESLFRDHGRYVLQGGACSAWLDNPTVTLANGRVVIRAHLSARVGMDLGDSCAGVDLASWATVSGVPAAQGTRIRLSDIRVEDVGDANTRIVLNSGLAPTLPGALDLDVLKAVRAMLQGASGQLQADVQALNIESVRVADNRLAVRFDFRVVGR